MFVIKKCPDFTIVFSDVYSTKMVDTDFVH
jgi:hypothetical protein